MSDCPHTWWIPADCPDCKGEGEYPYYEKGILFHYTICPTCKGTGKKEGFEECDKCHIVTIATFETNEK